MGKEATAVWSPLKKVLINRRISHQRIEDKLTPGIPDVNIHAPRVGDVWVELKHVETIPRDDRHKVEVGLRPEQYIWLRDGQKAGRICYLLAKVGVGWYVWTDARDWEMAKHPAPWVDLLRRANRFTDLDAVVNFLCRHPQSAS